MARFIALRLRRDSQRRLRLYRADPAGTSPHPMGPVAGGGVRMAGKSSLRKSRRASANAAEA